ncbi:hypothetical protein [Streptomyces asiaticus]|uniref:hypothetical protein n=1 Tax=Streptomyces asiaticus TaxID=114695 RepID=UPI001BA8C68B|nr:hypothetical protein [Streptomyces asiaticus]
MPERETEIRKRIDRLNGDRVMTGSTWRASSVGPKSVFPPEQSHVVEDVLETKHSVIRGSVGVFGDKQHAEFTAHAPDDIAALLAELNRIRAERQQTNAALAERDVALKAAEAEVSRLTRLLGERDGELERLRDRAEAAGDYYRRATEAKKRVAELERAAVEGRAALANLIEDHEDPGTAALGALYLLSQATTWVDAQPDDAGRVMRAHDAKVLRQAADEADGRDLPDGYIDTFESGADWVTADLRRLADASERGDR